MISKPFLSWEWEGKIDVSWVDWGRVHSLYCQIYSQFDTRPNHYMGILGSLAGDGVYANDFISSLMTINKVFKIPFQKIPTLLGTRVLETKAILLYRLEVGK